MMDISSTELQTLKEAFELYDVHKNGYLNTTEFKNILRNLDMVQNKTLLQHIINTNSLDKIDFEEFANIMYHLFIEKTVEEEDSNDDDDDDEEEEAVTPTSTSPVTPNILSQKLANINLNELQDCFNYFDQNNDGLISEKELNYVINSKLNANLSLYEIKEMMNFADKNKDGYIDFNEFKQLIF